MLKTTLATTLYKAYLSNSELTVKYSKLARVRIDCELNSIPLSMSESHQFSIPYYVVNTYLLSLNKTMFHFPLQADIIFKWEKKSTV